MKTNAHKQQPVLVIGSTGKTGRRVSQLLQEQGHTVRAGARGSEPAFDWQKPEGWATALAGVQAAYISYFPDLAVPEAPAAIERLVAEARRAGVRRLVLLSGRGEANAQRCESIVAQSGLEYSLVRASWFAQNFSEGALLPQVLSGTIAMPAGDVREPFVDVDDIAEVAVAALGEDNHNGRLYEVTGPRLLSFAEAAAEIARAAGRDIQYVPISFDELYAGMSPVVGEAMAGMFTELCREVLDGRNASTANGVREALGREPRDFADYCRAMAATGIWQVPAGVNT